jgi:hypothetical protein
VGIQIIMPGFLLESTPLDSCFRRNDKRGRNDGLNAENMIQSLIWSAGF